MKPIHVAATIVRLFAIFLFVYLINFSVSSLSLIAQSEEYMVAIFELMAFLVMLAIILFLWFFPVSISRKLTGISSSADDQKLDFTKEEFLSICVFSTGIYFLYGLLGEGIYWFKFLNNPVFMEMQSELTVEQKANLWALYFRAIFVLLLLLGNRVIVKVYKALRYGG